MVDADELFQDAIERMNEIEALGFKTLAKASFSCGKCLYTLNGIKKAIDQYSRDGDTALSRQAVRLLRLFGTQVVLITIYKFTSKAIAPLFVLQLLSHYSCFLVFAALTGFGSHPKIKKGGKGDRRIQLAIWAMHLVFGAALVVGLEHSVCSDDVPYPLSFILSDCLFFAVYFILRVMKTQGFDKYHASKDDDDGEGLELFEEQCSAFFKKYKILVFLHVIEIVIGYVLLNTSFLLEGVMSCSPDGNHWVYSTEVGSLFLLMHTVVVKQNLGLASVVFIKTVKKQQKKSKKKDD